MTPRSTSPLPGAVENDNDFGERTPVLLHGVSVSGSRPPSATIDNSGVLTGDTTPSQTLPHLIAPESELDHIGFGRFQVVMLIILGLANASDAVELLALSFILPKLDTTDNAKAALSAAIFVGMLFGGLFFGIAADSLGRRTTLAVSLSLNAFFGLISSIAPTTSFLFVARALGGFGVGGSIPGVFTLAAELLPSARRSFWLSTVAWWWMIGAIYAAGFAWIMIGVLSLSWQMFAVVASLPALLASLLVFFCLPESPRFLHGVGRNIEASAVLMRIAKTNGVESRLCRGWELQPIPDTQEDTTGEEEAGPLLFTGTQTQVENPQKNHFVTSDVSEGGKLVTSPSNIIKSTISSRMQRLALSLNVKSLMKSLLPLRQLFDSHNGLTAGLLSIVWFCLSFGWYGLLLWIPTLLTESGVDLDPYQDSFFISAANLPGNIVSAVLMDRVGVKPVLFYSMILACVSAAFFPFARTEATVLLAACSLNAVSTCSWNSLDCLSTEAFPTQLRTTALGVLSASGRLGSITGQFVFGALKSKVPVLLSVAAGMLGVGAIAALALPKTSGGGTVVCRPCARIEKGHVVR